MQMSCIAGRQKVEKEEKQKELLRLLLSAETRWRTTSGSRCFVEPKADWRAIYTC